MWAVIPVKDLAGAKQRLAPVLAPKERQELFLAMLGDVLAALAATASLEGIAMITRDAVAQDLAGRVGAEIISEDENDGQTAAVNFGIAQLMSRGVSAILQVPGDVPLALASEFEQAIAAHQAVTAPAMTIVPARNQLGSNCVLCSPPNALPLRFGDNSFYPHLDAAHRLGIQPTILPLSGLGLDIDTPDDLSELLTRTGDSRAQIYLAESGIAARLGEKQKSA